MQNSENVALAGFETGKLAKFTNLSERARKQLRKSKEKNRETGVVEFWGAAGQHGFDCCSVGWGGEHAGSIEGCVYERG